MQSAPSPRETEASTPSSRKTGPEEWPKLEEEPPPPENSAFDSFDGIHDALDRIEVEDGEGDSDDDGSEDFEFAVVSRDSVEGLESISANEIFFNGQILPTYPLFNRGVVGEGSAFQHQNPESARSAAEGRGEKPAGSPLMKLMREEDKEPPSTSVSSSAAKWEADDLEGISADSYCPWTPSSAPASPEMRRRSHSTGVCSAAASSKRWRLRDLIIGRSQSDGRKKLFFLAPRPSSSAKAPAEKTGSSSADAAPPPPAEASAPDKKKGKGKGKGRVRLEMDIVTAHRLYYGKGGAAAEDRRRSYLPYRKVGLFANVNGGGRSLQSHFF